MAKKIIGFIKLQVPLVKQTHPHQSVQLWVNVV